METMDPSQSTSLHAHSLETVTDNSRIYLLEWSQGTCGIENDEFCVWLFLILFSLTGTDHFC